jgi:hypothetical protein
MQMVVHDREPAHGERENLREFLDPIFNPRFPLNRQVHPMQAVPPKRFGSPIPSTPSADVSSRW